MNGVRDVQFSIVLDVIMKYMLNLNKSFKILRFLVWWYGLRVYLYKLGYGDVF